MIVKISNFFHKTHGFDVAKLVGYSNTNFGAKLAQIKHVMLFDYMTELNVQ